MEKLIRRCQQGDREALGELYTTMHDELLAHCRKYEANDDTANDLLHDAFLLIFSNIEKLRSPEKGRQWMHKVVKNVCLLYVQQRQNRPLIPVDETKEAAQVTEPAVPVTYDELQKAIGRRDPVMCNRIINYFASNPKKNPIQQVLPILYSYFLKVMFYHQLENKSDAAKVLGCAPSFVQDYAVAASNYSLGKLATCIGYLYETDLRSKGVRNSGTVTDGELLKELIFKVIH